MNSDLDPVLQKQKHVQVEDELEVVKMVGICMEWNESLEDNVRVSEKVEGENILILGWRGLNA